METIIPSEPVFFFTENSGYLFRIMAYFLKGDGDVDVLVDNGRTIKNFNRTNDPDFTFTGHICPEWIWRRAKKVAASIPQDHFEWRTQMFGIRMAEPEQNPPRPAQDSLSWALADLLSRRTAGILSAMGIETVKDLLAYKESFLANKALESSNNARSELSGFLAAYGKKLR